MASPLHSVVVYMNLIMYNLVIYILLNNILAAKQSNIQKIQ